MHFTRQHKDGEDSLTIKASMIISTRGMTSAGEGCEVAGVYGRGVAGTLVWQI